MLRRCFLLGFALCTLGVAPCRGQDTWQEQAKRLAGLLNWHPGAVVAEIGAGDGKLTLLAAQRVGPSGMVYTTELDPKKLAHLEELAAKERNITAVKAAQTGTNLPPGCCDSIFMRLVYHHFTNPAEIDASLFRSLKVGGRLAVIDEDPMEGSSIPEGVPKNRGGHGIPQKILVSELQAAGFEVESVHDDWPSRDASHLIYCVVFRKARP
jgi:ubiquinone/menaquinone biosynthesis C-methylase UbiE